MAEAKRARTFAGWFCAAMTLAARLKTKRAGVSPALLKSSQDDNQNCMPVLTRKNWVES